MQHDTLVWIDNLYGWSHFINILKLKDFLTIKNTGCRDRWFYGRERECSKYMNGPRISFQMSS